MTGPGDGPKRRWLTATSTIEQDCSLPHGCGLVEAVGDARHDVDPLGANWLEAGAGVWAARLQGHGYRDSAGRTHPDWRPLSVDPWTGAIIVCDYTTGRGLWQIWPGGRVDQIVDVALDKQEACAVAGVVTYRAGGQLRRWPDGAVAPVLLDDARHTGTGWLCGDQAGLTVYHWNLPQLGLRLGHGQDFNPDICAFPDGRLRVVSSRRAGEGPDDAQVFDIDPRGARPIVNGKPADWVDLTARVIEPFTHPCGVGAWFDHSRAFLTTGTPDPRFPVAGAQGVFLDTRDRHAFPQGRALARQLRVPFWVYTDGRPFDYTALEAGDAILLNCYLVPGHSTAGTLAEIESACQGAARTGRIWGQAISLHGGWDGVRMVRDEQQVLDVAHGAVAIGRRYGVQLVYCFFAGVRTTNPADRPVDGIDFFPSFRRFYDQLRAAVPDADRFPVLVTEPVDPPKPPKPEEPKPPVIPKPEDPMKTRLIRLRAANGQLVTIEPGGDLNARATPEVVAKYGTGYQDLTCYLLDDVHDVGKRVVFEGQDSKRFVGSVNANLFAAEVFTVERGEFPGSWAYRSGSRLLSFNLDPNGPRGGNAEGFGWLTCPAYLDNPKQAGGWQSLFVVDAKTGQELADPF